MLDLEDKVVVITGAANGLGRALATEFYQQRCHLALIDINLPGLESLRSDLKNASQTITIHAADISSEHDIISIHHEIILQHKHVDILINNAAISISQQFEELNLADYRRLIDINFWGTVYCTKYFLSDLKQRENSRLVNVISDFALMGFPGKTAYASSKSAIMGFTHCLKTELSDSAIKVSLVIPPPLDTGLVVKGKHSSDERKKNEAAFLKNHGMPIDKTAKRIVAQIKRGKYRIVVGAMIFWIDLLSRLFPSTTHNLIGKHKKRFDFV